MQSKAELITIQLKLHKCLTTNKPLTFLDGKWLIKYIVSLQVYL